MAGYEQKVQESRSFSVYKARCHSGSSLDAENSEEVDSNATEGMDLLVRVKATKRRAKVFFFHVLIWTYNRRYDPD